MKSISNGTCVFSFVIYVKEQQRAGFFISVCSKNLKCNIPQKKVHCADVRVSCCQRRRFDLHLYLQMVL